MNEWEINEKIHQWCLYFQPIPAFLHLNFHSHYWIQGRKNKITIYSIDGSEIGSLHEDMEGRETRNSKLGPKIQKHKEITRVCLRGCM